MSGFKAMLSKDFRETLSSPSTYTGPLLALTYTIMMIVIVTRHVSRYQAQEMPVAEISLLLQQEINATTLALSLLAILALAMAIATAAVVFEKKARTLESLLATPVELRNVWRTKTMTIALACIPLGTLLSLATVFGLCHWVINPHLPAPVWPATSAIIAALIVIPVAMFFLLDIYVGLQFVISNHRFSSVLFIVLLVGAIVLNVVFQESADSWVRYALLGAVAAGLWLLDIFLAQFVTVERVVLSNKG